MPGEGEPAYRRAEVSGPQRGFGQRSTSSPAARVLSIILVAALAPWSGPAWAVRSGSETEAHDYFRDGLQALEEKRWDVAEQHFRAAAEILEGDGHPVDKWDRGRRRINTRGWREAYLPHFFLGQALYNQSRCAEAVTEWNRSESLGAIQSKNQLHRELQGKRASCENRE